ncbi:somatic embryogenesis receptor kinase 4 [Vigna unguiculata]|uniref:Somatic embryogenesis receptor kinase 4 n=1 Tax=Vigna unguiculata TaxID=3917 RepID=A0A4D6MJD4_VIGUN|nr:somatic embryogenesis receptor kinase 4 [Vigna unguiculata]
MWIERALIVLVLLLHQIHGGDGCSPSSCGKIRNISYPFRLKGEPEGCGPFALSCENNITLISLFSGAYHVEAINYNNFTVRVVDPGLQPTNCSSLPRYFIAPYNFSDYSYFEDILGHGVSGNRKYVDTGGCLNWNSKGYTYAMAGELLAKDVEVGCDVKLVALTSRIVVKMMAYAISTLECSPGDDHGEVTIVNIIQARYVIGTILFIVLLIYKWKRRHSSAYKNIENYLEQNSLMPIRYLYKQIEKMTTSFNEKLGEGDYGSVFKGKLRNGSCVAVKVLRKSKGNGQDFINEVATIGRIHHQNIVNLIGYCVEGSKLALIYEFMPNGSLDKFIFSKEGNQHLSYDTIYNIEIGVARGISYLYSGCEMHILHFDIKPQNILLDENFTPKISDFGLAKLYPTDKSVVTMTTTKGTIGYMAPELFYRNVGRISNKSDVYSFGMLLMEITSNRKNLNPHAEHSSQLYFPFWVYDQLDKGKDIEMEDVIENENKVTKKMIIVSLWCIQLKPNNRPSMNKVIEMLEGDIENLQIPPKPSLYPHETFKDSQRICSDFINSSSFSMEIAIDAPLKEKENVTNAHAHEMRLEMKCNFWRRILSLEPWMRMMAWMRDKWHDIPLVIEAHDKCGHFEESPFRSSLECSLLLGLLMDFGLEMHNLFTINLSSSSLNSQHILALVKLQRNKNKSYPHKIAQFNQSREERKITIGNSGHAVVSGVVLVWKPFDVAPEMKEREGRASLGSRRRLRHHRKYGGGVLVDDDEREGLAEERMRNNNGNVVASTVDDSFNGGQCREHWPWPAMSGGQKRKEELYSHCFLTKENEKNFALVQNQRLLMEKRLGLLPREVPEFLEEYFGEAIVKEFYANATKIHDEEPYLSYIRGRRLPFDVEIINSFLGTKWEMGDIPCQYAQLVKDVVDYREIDQALCILGGTFTLNNQQQPTKILRPNTPCSHPSNVTMNRSIILYTIVISRSLNVGWIITNEIHQCAHVAKPKAPLGHPSLITHLCQLARVDTSTPPFEMPHFSIDLGYYTQFCLLGERAPVPPHDRR